MQSAKYERVQNLMHNVNEQTLMEEHRKQSRRKAVGVDGVTKEDYDKAEKEMKGKKVVVKSENAGKVRSLHHIDDEDYDDTRDAALARKAAMEAEEAAKKADEKAPAVEAAPVKDESDKKSNEKKD